MKSFKAVAIVIVLLVLMNACVYGMLQKWEAVIQEAQKSGSWDQENLKKNDKGCPTAIYVAPDGVLRQCQESFEQLATVVAPKEYATIEQAAIAAFKAIAIKPSSQYYEWGGEIVKTDDGKFAAMAPNTSFGGDHVNIEESNFIMNATVVGSYHTHPCLPHHYVEYFSPPDLIEPLFMHRVAFMGDFCTGNVHEFIPGDVPDTEHPFDHGHTGAGFFLTKGRVIGQFTTTHTLTVIN